MYKSLGVFPMYHNQVAFFFFFMHQHTKVSYRESQTRFANTSRYGILQSAADLVTVANAFART